MDIGNWQYTVKDIAMYPGELMDPAESVLSNSVRAANFDLLQLLRPGERILEVGCGAGSYLRDNLPLGVEWHGIDICAYDSRGRGTIASKLGSVHAIPFDNGYFDWVVTNQSIEHWFEFNVELEQGLAEISRVLKLGGKARINFPLHLHGHPLFVKGDLDAITAIADPNVLALEDISAFIDSHSDNYYGWRLCGFPDCYVWSGGGGIKSSFVVEMAVRKISDQWDTHPEFPTERELELGPRLSGAERALVHGPYVLCWKILLRFKRLGMDLKSLYSGRK